jgi:hypothetical protein
VVSLALGGHNSINKAISAGAVLVIIFAIVRSRKGSTEIA